MTILSTENLIFNENIKYPDISIPELKATFITGPSGSGKTTLFRIFNKMLNWKSGKILFKGKDIASINPLELRKSIVLAGQEAFLFPGTIKDNFNTYYNYMERENLTESAMGELLALTNMDIPLETDISILSGGQKQRVFIAILLSFRPEVILLDEPTSALDMITARIFMKNIIDFSRENKITPIIISHAQELAAEFAENSVDIGGEKR